MLNNSPFVLKPASVQSVMLRVLLALVPGVVAYVWIFGYAILMQLAIASVTALIAEALVLSLRKKPLQLFLTDGSAVLTACLLALSVPPIAPWWLVALGTFFAIVVAKHLYGGLGQNPFNPAMVGFALMIVAYPQLMSQWPAPSVDAGTGIPDISLHLQAIFGERHLDAITMATPLDAVRTALHSGTTLPLPTGGGWQWVAVGYVVGGVYLLQQRLISWHLPVAFIGTLVALSGGFHWLDAQRYAGPMFHLFSGGAMLGAFFIITDPVSGCTTPRGKLIFGALAALLTWLIRTFGAYPDGIAFSVLLMNIAAPLIDMFTQPAVFGYKKSSGPK